MSRRRSFIKVTVVGLVGLSLLLGATGSSAEPGPITLASTNGLEQANQATFPALSADGRYLAFTGKIGGLGGVFRKDLVTGEVASVATRPLSEREGQGAEATEPSISADGRFVSFNTGEQLDPAEDPTPDTSDVYVADMSASPPSYTLVSARDESSHGLTYEKSGVGVGSISSSRTAISADGNEVAFVTTVASDLTGAAGGTEAPAFQVAVRNLAARRTILVSVGRDPATGAMQPTVPVPGGATYALPTFPPGAAISADGSTVAWIGAHIPLQAAVTAAEAAEIAHDEGTEGQYDEPLWRRLPTAAEPAPQTRRIVSAARFPDVLSGKNQELVAGCETAKGWITAAQQVPESTPSLSADGDEMALTGQPGSYSDAYWVDMSGEPVVRQLTRAIAVPLGEGCSVNANAFAAGSATVTGVAISPAGDRVGLTTVRQRFPLAPPNLVGTPPARLGLADLYLVDLTLGTLQRLTHGADEAEPSLSVPESAGSGTVAVSFDGSGETLAFASGASNLVLGDGNGEFGGSDVFLVSDPRNVPKPGTSVVTAKPPPLRTMPRWILTARATSRPDGSVRVAVTVPGAGRLKALAKTDGGKGVKSRRVAVTRRRAFLASTLAFDLDPARRFRAPVRARGGVEAKLALEFRGSGGRPLHLDLHIRFHAHTKKGARR